MSYNPPPYVPPSEGTQYPKQSNNTVSNDPNKVQDIKPSSVAEKLREKLIERGIKVPIEFSNFFGKELSVDQITSLANSLNIDLNQVNTTTENAGNFSYRIVENGAIEIVNGSNKYTIPGPTADVDDYLKSCDGNLMCLQGYMGLLAFDRPYSMLIDDYNSRSESMKLGMAVAFVRQIKWPTKKDGTLPTVAEMKARISSHGSLYSTEFKTFVNDLGTVDNASKNLDEMIALLNKNLDALKPINKIPRPKTDGMSQSIPTLNPVVPKSDTNTSVRRMVGGSFVLNPPNQVGGGALHDKLRAQFNTLVGALSSKGKQLDPVTNSKFNGKFALLKSLEDELSEFNKKLTVVVTANGTEGRYSENMSENDIKNYVAKSAERNNVVAKISTGMGELSVKITGLQEAVAQAVKSANSNDDGW